MREARLYRIQTRGGGAQLPPQPHVRWELWAEPPPEKPPHPGVTKACAQRPQDLGSAGIIT